MSFLLAEVKMSKIVSMDFALNLIKDGDSIASSGFVLSCTPESLFRALGKKYEKTQSPKNLTCIFCASQGDGEGQGYDHLAQDGMISKIIGGHFGLTPKLIKYINDNKCLAYNYPLGVVSAIFNNAVQNKSGELTKIGLKTFIDPRLEGGKINDITKDDLIKIVEFQGEEWLYYPTPNLDIGLIRGTTADEDGNVSIEHEAVKLELLLIAMAVKAKGGKVIVQVKNIAKKGALSANRIEIPGIFVDAVVVSPNPEEEHRQTKSNFYDPSKSGCYHVPIDKLPIMNLNFRKIIARRAAMELKENSIINLGIGIPEGVALVAAEEGFGDKLILTTESGLFGGIPCGGGDFGAGQNTLGVVDMRTVFDFYDGGGLDAAVLGLAEVNSKGDINVSKFGVRTPGCGGFINISQNTGKIIFCGSFTSGGNQYEIGDGKLKIIKEGSSKKFVKKIQQITYSGEFGAETNQDVLYVTERAVFKLTKKGIKLIEIAPGIDLKKDILGQMEFMPIIDDELKFMDERIFKNETMNYKV